MCQQAMSNFLDFTHPKTIEETVLEGHIQNVTSTVKK